MNLTMKHSRSNKRLILCAAIIMLVFVSSGVALAGNNARDNGPRPSANAAALYKLQSNFHLAASTKDIQLLMSLFAEDATFVGPGNITYVGRTEVGKGFLTTGAYKPGNNWAGLTPTFRTQIHIIDSHHATMYFECDYVDRVSLQVKAQLTANTTEVRREGQWFFETFSGGPAPPL